MNTRDLERILRNKRIKEVDLIKKSLVIEFTDKSRLFIDNVNDLDEISYTE